MTKQLFEGRVAIGPLGDLVAIEDFKPSMVTEEEALQSLVEKLNEPVQMNIIQATASEDIDRWDLVTFDHCGKVRPLRPEERWGEGLHGCDGCCRRPR